MGRGVTTYTCPQAAVKGCALFLLPAALIMLTGFAPALNLTLLTLLAAPACLMIVGLTAGFIPMAVCLAALLGFFGLCGSGMLAGCAALYLLPVTAVYIVCLRRGVPFWRSCGMLAGVLALSQLAIYLLLQAHTDNQLYMTAGVMAAKAVNAMPYRDDFLYSMVSYGLLRVPAVLRDNAVVSVPGGYALSAELLEELLLQVSGYVQDTLRGLVPGLLVTGSALHALAGLGLAIHFGLRSAEKRAYKYDEETLPVPDLDMPPLRTWHLARPWGLRIGVLAVGYFLARVPDNQVLSLLGTLMFQVFSLCFGVQGLAALNDSQHKRGTGRAWRAAVVVMALALRFMQIALIAVGVIDQITNARGLRPPMRPRDEEE